MKITLITRISEAPDGIRRVRDVCAEDEARSLSFSLTIERTGSGRTG